MKTAILYVLAMSFGFALRHWMATDSRVIAWLLGRAFPERELPVISEARLAAVLNIHTANTVRAFNEVNKRPLPEADEAKIREMLETRLRSMYVVVP